MSRALGHLLHWRVHLLHAPYLRHHHHQAHSLLFPLVPLLPQPLPPPPPSQLSPLMLTSHQPREHGSVELVDNQGTMHARTCPNNTKQLIFCSHFYSQSLSLSLLPPFYISNTLPLLFAASVTVLKITRIIPGSSARALNKPANKRSSYNGASVYRTNATCSTMPGHSALRTGKLSLKL